MTKKDRYIPNDKSPDDPELPQVCYQQAHEELLLSVTRTVREVPPDETTRFRRSGFYDGSLSIALLFYRLSTLYPNAHIFDRDFQYWARAYANALPSDKHHPTPDSCGVVNERLAKLCLSTMLDQDAESAKYLCSYKDSLLGEDGADEWLYGRSGYLYLLRNARHAFPNEPEWQQIRTLLTETMEEVADRIMKTYEEAGAWIWHGKEYFGPVHGTIGIILQIALSTPSKISQLEPLLVKLLDEQLDSGNWRSSATSSHDDVLVQFCHGACGFVVSLMSLKTLYPHLTAKIDTAIEKARKCIFERGLLRKMPGLCHGIVGNALTLPVHQARYFLTFTTADVLDKNLANGIFEATEKPWGLYSGEAGRAWGWAVADSGEKNDALWGIFIGYNDG